MALTWQNLGPMGGRRAGFLTANLTRNNATEVAVPLVDVNGNPVTLTVTPASKIMLVAGYDNLGANWTWRFATPNGSVSSPAAVGWQEHHICRINSPGTGALSVFVKFTGSGSDFVYGDQCMISVV